MRLQVLKEWFLGFGEEVFIVDSHQGVRLQEPSEHKARCSDRGLRYLDVAKQRRAMGLPPDIYETEPDFLMEPLLSKDPAVKPVQAG